MVESLRTKLLTRRAGRIAPESIFEAENNALYNALIMPVLKYVPRTIRNLLIVPDGNLAILPFDILRENSGSPYLAERYSITRSPSLSVSVVARQKEIESTEPIIAFGGAWYEKEEIANSPTSSYVGNRLAALSDRIAALRGSMIAGEELKKKTRAVDYFNQDGKSWYYLEGSVAEVEGLREIATLEPMVIMGRDVSKRNIKRLSLEGTLLDYPIIHFATHGYFNDNLIPQAALVLSEYSGLISESREDGYLSIEDIVLFQLNARMVMLSACETGMGQIKRGDGMSGLSRAFMTAGAQNVGVSLWQISDDATVEFMWGVYRKVIHEEKSFRDAYSEVKEEFRNSTRWYHPYYWACFTLYE
jgi:CHAT domain-containing protein